MGNLSGESHGRNRKDKIARVISKYSREPPGWTSDFFELQRGVREGFPLSPYLFVLSVKKLAKRIRKSKDIKGIYRGKQRGN